MTTVPALAAATEVGDSDLLYAVVDPAGTPLDRKITAGELAESDPFATRYEAKQTVSMTYTELSPAQQTIALNTTIILYTWSYTATQRGFAEFFAATTLYGASGTQSAAGNFYLRDTITPQTLGTFRWHTNAAERQVQAYCWGKLWMPSAGSYEVQLICTSDAGSAQSMQNRDTRLTVTRTDF